MVRKIFLTICILSSFSFCVSAGEIADKYCEFSVNSEAIGWKGNPGPQALKPPQVTVSADAAVGKTSVRAEVVSNGEYQGIEFTLPETIDLAGYGSISFWIKQGYWTGPRSDCVFRIFFENGTSIYCNINSGNGEWTYAEVPLESRRWIAGPLAEVSFGLVKKVDWYPYTVMSAPGLYIMIDGLRFNPKEEGIHSLRPSEYYYLLPPKAGDQKTTILTDGKVSKESQVEWSPNNPEPDIVFDLGGTCLVDQIKIEAVGIPSQNISSIIILVSPDKNKWQSVASIVNKDAGGMEKVQVLEKSGLQVAGRYVRLQVTRPRQDFPIFLSEVSFFGKTPTPQELEAAAARHYQVGPALPEVTQDNYWKLADNEFTAWVEKKTGVINGLFRKDQKLAERICDYYVIHTKTATEESDGYQDRVISQRWEGKLLCLQLENVKLPGLQFEKRYRISENRLESTTTITNVSRNQTAFLSTGTEVVLSQEYRRDGIYESWPSGHSMTRKFASEIGFDFPAVNEAALNFENARSLDGLFHYIYRLDGKYLPLGTLLTPYNFGSVTEQAGYKNTTFTANGWKVATGIFKLDKQKHSVETHLSYVPGSLLSAYDAYLNLPEVKQFRDNIKRPEWIKEVRCVGDTGGWNIFGFDAAERMLNRYFSLLREGYIIVPGTGDIGFTWGDFPIEGMVRNAFGGIRSAEEVRAEILKIKALSPRLKLGFYTWLWSVNPDSTPYQKHPEWFVVKDRNGQELSFFPGYSKNYRRLVGIKGSQDEVFDQIHKMINYYGLDIWYLDGGYSEANIDWDKMYLDEPDSWDNLLARLRKTLQAENPERALFFNTPNSPLADFGFLENFSGALTSNWRTGAAWMWKFKTIQHRDPLHTLAYIYWLPSVEGGYEYYLAGLGMLPAYVSRLITPIDVPYLSANYEIRPLQLTEANLTPNWRYDKNTSLETYPLTLGKTGFIFIRSHATTPVPEKVGITLPLLGITDAHKPVYQWQFEVRDARKWHGRLGEAELARIYSGTGWRLDRAVIPEFLGAADWQERTERTFQTEPEKLLVWVLTQSPALVYSVDNLPNQYWLPESLGVKVDGLVEGNAINLEVESNRNEAEIGVILPEGLVPKEVVVSGKKVTPKILRANNVSLVLIRVEKGNQRVVVTLNPEKAAVSIPAVTAVSSAAPGQNIDLKISLQDDWIGKTLLIKLEKDGVVHWSSSILANDLINNLKLSVPLAVEGGDYQLIASGISGKPYQEAAIKISGGQSQIALPPEFVNLPSEEKIFPCTVSDGKIEITNYGLQFNKGSNLVSVVPEKKIISIATAPMIESIHNTVSGGLEMKVARYLKLRLSGNFMYFNTHGVWVGSPYNFSSNYENSFIGLVFDFNAARGYATRTAAGLGVVEAKRSSPVPTNWGTKQKADRIFALNDFVLQKNIDTLEMWVDLKKLGAPDDWTGKIWLSAVFEKINSDRKLTVEVLDTSDTLSAGVVPVAGVDLIESMGKRLEFPIFTTEKPIVLDGKLTEECWTKAGIISGLSVLGKPGEKESQESIIRVLYDQQNLYLGMEIKEKEKESFLMKDPNQPWYNDSMEFCLGIAGTKSEYLHGVIDAYGNMYRAIEGGTGSGKNETTNLLEKSAATRNPGVYFIEIAVPFTDLGIQEKPEGREIRFNIMRNRYIKGNSQNLTLVPGSSYFDVDRFYTLKLEK